MPPSASHKNAPISGFLFHLHPRMVAAETTRFTLSFGLGGMAATLLVVLMVTGPLQLLSYSADSSRAYESIIDMYRFSSPAGFIRNIHHWAGNLLVLVGLLHLLRVFLTGAIGRRHRLNWLIGLSLFLLVLFANFTGYLLPWDQLSFWAVTIFTNMVGYLPLVGERITVLLRGSTEVGPATLRNFFAIHVGIIPPLLVLLMIYHFWLIRKTGGLVRSRKSKDSVRMVASVPYLVAKEAAVGLGLCALLFLFSALIDAPLAEIANPGASPNPAKAAWYFMGLQELLLHLHPVFAICIVPLLTIGALALLPFIKNGTLEEGVWCGGRRGLLLGLGSFLAGMLVTVLLVVGDERLLMGSLSTALVEPWISRGMLPLGVVFLAYLAVYKWLRYKRFERSQAIMALVLLGVGIVCGLTMIGTWFRGLGMALTF